MSERQTCIGCATQSPETETNYTLISSQFGWRLNRRQGAGGIVVEWRCPTCWQEFKKSDPLAQSGANPVSERKPGAPGAAARVTASSLANSRGRGFFTSAVDELKAAIRPRRSEPPKKK